MVAGVALLIQASHGGWNSGQGLKRGYFNSWNALNERFYEKVIKVKADVAALLNLFSDVSIDVQW
jgi:hypothetical protein